MAWVKYRKLDMTPERVHRVGEHLFDGKVNDGLCDVRDSRSILKLTQRCHDCGSLLNYQIALERYGISFDEAGNEKELHVQNVVETPSDEESGDPEIPEPKRRGRPRKA